MNCRGSEIATIAVMQTIAHMVNSLGGMAQKQQLVRRGASDWDLTYAVRTRSVVRVRNGWYTTLPEGDVRVRAVRVGGRLTGISAIQAWGGWVLDQHPLHVSVLANAARLRSQSNRWVHPPAGDIHGVVLHWDSPELSERGTAVSVSLLDALHEVIVSESTETAIAALDWAGHTGQIDEIDLHRLMAMVPNSKRFDDSLVDFACESLPESLSRTRFRLAGHHVVSQVPLGPKRIDLVIDGIVGFEVDGEEFHWDKFLPDRQKDRDINLVGYHAMRFAAVMVFYEWAEVLAAVEVAIAARAPNAHSGNSGTAARKRRKPVKRPTIAKEILSFQREEQVGRE